MLIPPAGGSGSLAIGAPVGGATAGLLKVAGGVLAQATSADYLAPAGSGAQLTGLTVSQIGLVPSGILKGVGGAFAAAVAGTDYPGLSTANVFSLATTGFGNYPARWVDSNTDQGAVLVLGFTGASAGQKYKSIRVTNSGLAFGSLPDALNAPPTDWLEIGNNGNIGIGTSGAFKLDVKGGVARLLGCELRFNDDPPTYATSILQSTAQFQIINNDTKPIVLGNNGTSRFTIEGNGSLTIWDGGHFAFGTATGTKLGTAANQKLAAFGATPIVRPSSTGQAAGFTAGVGSPVLLDSTFTGGTGSTAYTLGDLVKHLKALGWLAS